jgi:hypothetical protein
LKRRRSSNSGEPCCGDEGHAAAIGGVPGLD